MESFYTWIPKIDPYQGGDKYKTNLSKIEDLDGNNLFKGEGSVLGGLISWCLASRLWAKLHAPHNCYARSLCPCGPLADTGSQRQARCCRFSSYVAWTPTPCDGSCSGPGTRKFLTS